MKNITYGKKFVVAFFVVLLFASITISPLSVLAQTKEVDREALLLQIQQLTQLIKLLQTQLSQKVDVASYQLHAVDNQVIGVGSQSTLARISVTPRNVDTYLNNAEFELHVTDKDVVPWETFAALKVYYKGNLLLQQTLNKKEMWSLSQYGNSLKLWYGINVFNGNVKIPTKDGEKFEFVLETSRGARTSYWEVRIPNGGITVWDKVMTHRYIGGAQQIIPFAVSANGVSVMMQPKGAISVAQRGPSTIKITGELIPPTNCKATSQFEFLLNLGNGSSKTYTLADCKSVQIDETVIITPSQISQYAELIMRQVDPLKNVWVNYTQSRVQIISTDPINLKLIDLTGVGEKG